MILSSILKATLGDSQTYYLHFIKGEKTLGSEKFEAISHNGYSVNLSILAGLVKRHRTDKLNMNIKSECICIVIYIHTHIYMG